MTMVNNIGLKSQQQTHNGYDQYCSGYQAYYGYGYEASQYYKDYLRAAELSFQKQHTSVYYRPPQAPYNMEPKQEEQDPHRLQQRQKQIEFGKNTVGYKIYLKTVPKEERVPGNFDHPQTPNTHDKCSKRAFDGRVRQWRRHLHKWDPLGVQLDEDINNNGLQDLFIASQSEQQSTPRSQKQKYSNSRNRSPIARKGVKKIKLNPHSKIFEPKLVNGQDSDPLYNILYSGNNLTKGFRYKVQLAATQSQQQNQNGRNSKAQISTDANGKDKIKYEISSINSLNDQIDSQKDTFQQVDGQHYTRQLNVSQETRDSENEELYDKNLDNMVKDDNGDVNMQPVDKDQDQVHTQNKFQGDSQLKDDSQKEQNLQSKGLEKGQVKLQDQDQIIAESQQIVRDIEYLQNKNQKEGSKSQSQQAQYTKQVSRAHPTASLNSRIQENLINGPAHNQANNLVNKLNHENSAWFQRPIKSIYKDQNLKSMQNVNTTGNNVDQNRVWKQRKSAGVNQVKKQQIQNQQAGDQTKKDQFTLAQQRSSRNQKLRNKNYKSNKSNSISSQEIKNDKNLDNAPFKKALVSKKASNNSQEQSKSKPLLQQQNQTDQASKQAVNKINGDNSQLKESDVQIKIDNSIQKEKLTQIIQQSQGMDIPQQPPSISVKEVQHKQEIQPKQDIQETLSPPPGYEQADFNYVTSQNGLDNAQESDYSLGGTSKNLSTEQSYLLSTENSLKGLKSEEKSEIENNDNMDTPPGFELKSMLPQNFEFVVKSES